MESVFLINAAPVLGVWTIVLKIVYLDLTRGFWGWQITGSSYNIRLRRPMNAIFRQVCFMEGKYLHSSSRVVIHCDQADM